MGISIAVFNQASKIAIFPLVSITTSFVAEDEATQKLISDEENEELEKGFSIRRELEMEELVSLVGNLFFFSLTLNSFHLFLFAKLSSALN